MVHFKLNSNKPKFASNNFLNLVCSKEDNDLDANKEPLGLIIGPMSLMIAKKSSTNLWPATWVAYARFIQGDCKRSSFKSEFGGHHFEKQLKSSSFHLIYWDAKGWARFTFRTLNLRSKQSDSKSRWPSLLLSKNANPKSKSCHLPGASIKMRSSLCASPIAWSLINPSQSDIPIASADCSRTLWTIKSIELVSKWSLTKSEPENLLKG